MSTIIVGGDGFCGWPTTLRFLKNKKHVTIIDNLSRRKIDKKLSSNSLTPIASIKNRVDTAKKIFGKNKIDFENIDVSKNVNDLKTLIKIKKPKTIIHFGEQRSAPYSMIDSSTREYTVNNNISGTHNICSSILDVDPKIHLIHLGTMGVYGYSKEFGEIPEGYLDIQIKKTKKNKSILYPANPGSIYHMSKCLDQLIFQYYNKNWGLKVTDLHQGIVWGTDTPETKIHKNFTNRFDYDGIYGTVLNRFCSQAANKHPLTIYGTGGQTRAFIHISDTAKCISLAEKNCDFDNSRVRIFNQVSEICNLKFLAQKISKMYNVKIKYYKNPRKELKKNNLVVSRIGLKNLGFKPIVLDDMLLSDIKLIASFFEKRFKKDNILNSPKW
jgi:UDP-sulfoquinovose synthase